MNGAALRESYQALYLLPTAPRELVAEVYRILSREDHPPDGVASHRDGVDGDLLRTSYRRIIDPQREQPSTNGATSQRLTSDGRGWDGSGSCSRSAGGVQFPWQILHLDRRAPPAVVDIALRLRAGADAASGSHSTGEAGMAATNGHHSADLTAASTAVRDTELPVRTTLPRCKDRSSLLGTVQARLRGVGERLIHPRRSPVVNDHTDAESERWAEMGVRHDGVQTLCGAKNGSTSPRMAGQSASYLVSEPVTIDSLRVPLDSKALTLGNDATCDIMLTERERGGAAGAAARIWQRENDFMLHALNSEIAVLVNGTAATWALLEDGDQLQIGHDTFRVVLSEGEGGS